MATAAPSPTAEAICLVEPERTSPAAKTPSTFVRKIVVGHDEPAIVDVRGILEEAGVRIESDEDERSRRSTCSVLSAVARDASPIRASRSRSALNDLTDEFKRTDILGWFNDFVLQQLVRRQLRRGSGRPSRDPRTA